MVRLDADGETGAGFYVRRHLVLTGAQALGSASVVDVIEERGGEWSVVSSSIPAERLSSTRTRFRVRVPPRGEAPVTYRIRVVW